jgi:sugar phosphate permease
MPEHVGAVRGLGALVGTVSDLRRWQWRIFTGAWVTYGSFYLGRVNISVALPAIQMHFGWGRAEAGLIGSAFFWVYALGQLVNGRLGDLLPGRAFVAVGMLVSVGLNLAFGFSDQLSIMILLWAANGYAQSMGWGPILRTLSYWFPSRRRARLSALFAPSFVTGHIGSWMLSGWLVSAYGWRWAFWVPALCMVLSALVWIVSVRDNPSLVGLPRQGDTARRSRGGLSLWWATRHPKLRWVAVACAFMGMAKDGIILWGPTFLMETAGLQLGRAAVTAVLIPLCGLAGTLAAGWMSGRYFRSREAPVAALMLAFLAVGIVALRVLAPLGELGPVLVALGVIGAASYGANSILLTALPLGLGNEGMVSSSAGFLDFASYVGGGLSGALTGWLIDGWGWPAAFGFWLGAALAGAAALLPILRSRRST